MNAANVDRQALWDVYDYEVDMFNQMLSACQMGVREAYPQPIQNAIVESMLLHLRILVDILLSRGSDADDIKLTNLLPKFQSPLLGQLKDSYESSRNAGSPCWTLNKMLAHATTLRCSSYDYGPMLKIMRPIIVCLLDQIAQARNLSLGE